MKRLIFSVASLLIALTGAVARARDGGATSYAAIIIDRHMERYKLDPIVDPGRPVGRADVRHRQDCSAEVRVIGRGHR